MRYGHPPDAIEEYSAADVQEFRAALPVILENENPFLAGGDET